MPYVLSEWFLSEVDKYIAALNELRHRIFNALASKWLSLSRLILLLLKRIISIIKNWLKESKLDAWLKAIFHESYLGAFEGLYIFLYILHFFRAFLTLINYFTDQDNKNLVEVTKFLYACFKVFISLVMLIFLIVLIAHGFAPLGLLAYEHIKTFFRLYTFSKFAINFITLGFSYYQYKTCENSPDYSWLKAQYQSNVKKHTQILLVGGLITLALTVVSLGLVTGPWFLVMVGVASILLVIDMAKAIYFYVKGCDVPEPEVASLSQKNSLIDHSLKDYYYRKCRMARLKTINNAEDYVSNKIYLLKEIVVKIIQLESQLKNFSQCKRFFSPIYFYEKQKIKEKIEGLRQEASRLLNDDEKNSLLLNRVIEALKEDDRNVNKKDKTLISKKNIDHLIANDEITRLNGLFSARGDLRKKDSVCSQAYRQSFFRKKGDCEDISDACQKLRELEKGSLEWRLVSKPAV